MSILIQVKNEEKKTHHILSSTAHCIATNINSRLEKGGLLEKFQCDQLHGVNCSVVLQTNQTFTVKARWMIRYRDWYNVNKICCWLSDANKNKSSIARPCQFLLNSVGNNMKRV